MTRQTNLKLTKLRRISPLIFLLVWNTVSSFAIPMQVNGALNISVLQGNNAVNNIQEKKGTDPIVHVQDASGAPLAGVEVTFSLPLSGAGATFQNGQKTITSVTDAQGLATGRGLVPNTTAGPFEIVVVATYRNQRTRITIQQSNTGQSVRHPHGKLIAIVAAVGGAGAAAAFLRNSEKPCTPPDPRCTPPATITAGSPTPGSPR